MRIWRCCEPSSATTRPFRVDPARAPPALGWRRRCRSNSFFDGGVASLVSTPASFLTRRIRRPYPPAWATTCSARCSRHLRTRGVSSPSATSLDMATRACEALVRRLRDRRTLATVDADRSEREPADVEVQTDTDHGRAPPRPPLRRRRLTVAGSNSSWPCCQRLPLLRLAASRLLLPLGMIRWLGVAGGPSTVQRLAGIGAVDASGARIAEGEARQGDPEPASAGAPWASRLL